jgi:hypothetical protein
MKNQTAPARIRHDQASTSSKSIPREATTFDDVRAGLANHKAFLWIG